MAEMGVAMIAGYLIWRVTGNWQWRAFWRALFLVAAGVMVGVEL